MQRAPQPREQLGEGLPPCRARTHVAALPGSSDAVSNDGEHGGFLADCGAHCTGYGRDSGDGGGRSDIRILFGYCTILLGMADVEDRQIGTQSFREATKKARNL